MSVSPSTHSHCFIQWEDNKNDYAVVHSKRAKTSFALKVGLTTSFEGNNRDRRRGKILYMGTKNECTMFSFEFDQPDKHINTYSWSLPPGVPETTDEKVRVGKNMNTETFCRTTSSSSVNSTTTMVSKSKKRKVAKKVINTSDHQIAKDTSVLSVSSTTSNSILPSSSTSIITIDDNNQPLNPSGQQPLKTSDTHGCSNNSEKTASFDANSLVRENKILREKVAILEEQLMFQRETSIPIPSENCYHYLRSICSTYEQNHAEQNEKLVELAKKLPCSNVEMKLAKKSNPAVTINNLMKCCFKEIDFSEMSYEKFRAKDATLLADIYEYVKHAHAPSVISQSMFSGTISLKCRHLREARKNKNGDASMASKDKQCHSNTNGAGAKQKKENTIQEIELDEAESDKENDEHF